MPKPQSRPVAAETETIVRTPITRLLSALAVAAAWGALVGWLTPRGPTTGPDALATVLASLAVGCAAGALARTRWVVLAAPVAFAVALELVRLPVDGPTVDGIHLTQYGIFALVVGRVFHGLLTLLPLALGGAIGVAATREEGTDARHRWGGVAARLVTAIAALAVVALAVGVSLPASTAPVAAGDGGTASGVAELGTVTVNGHDLGLMVRGRDRSSPVLLFLAGGPGGSELGAMRRHLPALEDHFVVATLDQRGTGRSYGSLDPTDTMTLDGQVSDVVAVTRLLTERFDVDRVLLVGQSWGSTLGVLAVQQEPTLYSGLVGVGQMVSQLATDRIFYDDTLAWARRTGDETLVSRLEDIGPPPYTSMLDYETALSFEHQVYPYSHAGNSEGEGGFSENFLVPEYDLVEKVHLLGAFMDTFGALYPRLQDIDFRADTARLDVPVFFVQGAHEARGRAEPFEEWYAVLDAPLKDRVTFATSGHRPLFEQPDEFVDYLVGTVLPATS